jgi:hypothetical protein
MRSGAVEESIEDAVRERRITDRVVPALDRGLATTVERKPVAIPEDALAS